LGQSQRRGFPQIERIVALGLLTDQQAEFVLYRYVSNSRPTYSFGDDGMQETLGLTSEQRKRLTDIWEQSRLREARLNLFSVDPEVQKRNHAEMMANNKDTDATLALLSPNQRLIWSRTNVVRELAFVDSVRNHSKKRWFDARDLVLTGPNDVSTYVS
jgi:hypothetical protein